MLIGGSEGEGLRFEVLAREEGYLVCARDLDTGEIEPGEMRLFRTAAVAFAHAAAQAAFDRAATIAVHHGLEPALVEEAQGLEGRFAALRQGLADEGASITLERLEPRPSRPVMH